MDHTRLTNWPAWCCGRSSHANRHCKKLLKAPCMAACFTAESLDRCGAQAASSRAQLERRPNSQVIAKTTVMNSVPKIKSKLERSRCPQARLAVRPLRTTRTGSGVFGGNRRAKMAFFATAKDSRPLLRSDLRWACRRVMLCGASSFDQRASISGLNRCHPLLKPVAASSLNLPPRAPLCWPPHDSCGRKTRTAGSIWRSSAPAAEPGPT